MYRNILFLNSAENTFLWNRKMKVSCLSIYQNFFTGGCEYEIKGKQDFFDKSTLTWCSKAPWPLEHKKIKKKYELFFYSFNYIFFKKFKFIGKGYKIKKVRIKKSFQLYFGYSHKIFLISGGCQLRKLTKYKLFLITNNYKKIYKIRLIIKNIRKLNFFTKRGLRAMKQKIFKRPGKKSTY
jgi:hypothetical protein